MRDLLPALVLGAVAIAAIVGMVAQTVIFGRRETALRLKLGSCRTSLEACEAERDQMRRQFNAQAVELARYRGALPSHQRMTRVFVPGLPLDPDE